jgi:hypothetical protein
MCINQLIIGGCRGSILHIESGLKQGHLGQGSANHHLTRDNYVSSKSVFKITICQPYHIISHIDHKIA